MAMIKICKDCGMEIQGCTNCNRVCPVCGGDVEKRDLIQYLQAKERKKNAGKDLQPNES